MSLKFTWFFSTIIKLCFAWNHNPIPNGIGFFVVI